MGVRARCRCVGSRRHEECAGEAVGLFFKQRVAWLQIAGRVVKHEVAEFVGDGETAA